MSYVTAYVLLKITNETMDFERYTRFLFKKASVVLLGGFWAEIFAYERPFIR